MSFEFDNSKNKNHLLQSLIQELKQARSRLSPRRKRNITILKSFITTGLIFNFDLQTQIELSRIYESIRSFNKNHEMIMQGKPIPLPYGKNYHEMLTNMSDDIQQDINNIVKKLESIT